MQPMQLVPLLDSYGIHMKFIKEFTNETNQEFHENPKRIP
jgi:hypothetical protein